MAWPYPFGQTIHVLDGSGANTRYGEPAWNWPVKATYEKCAVGPRDANASTGNEATFQQDTVEEGKTVYGPPGMNVSSVDRIRVDDVDYDVVGDPQSWPSPYTGWNPGTLVLLQKAH